MCFQIRPVRRRVGVFFFLVRGPKGHDLGQVGHVAGVCFGVVEVDGRRDLLVLGVGEVSFAVVFEFTGI